MNYRHAYHAGNHADVVKHAILALAVEHFKKKEKPFRFLDLHAGIGVYDLAGGEAEKTLEWQGGVGRMAEAFAAPIEALLKPYRGRFWLATAALFISSALGLVYPKAARLAVDQALAHKSMDELNGIEASRPSVKL